MRRAFLVSAVLASALALLHAPAEATVTAGSSGAKRVEGSGNVVDQARAVSGFGAIKVSGPMNVELKAGDQEQVSVRFDDNLQAMIRNEYELVHSAGIAAPQTSPYAYLVRIECDMEHDEEFGFDCINIYEGPNTVFVFIVTGEKAIILEDSKGIFPSDRIVAQVRLMQEQI